MRKITHKLSVVSVLTVGMIWCGQGFVASTAAPPDAEQQGGQTMQGVVLDVQGNQLSVAQDLFHRLNFQVARDATIRIDDRETPLSEFRPGDVVKVTYETQEGINVAREIHGSR